MRGEKAMPDLEHESRDRRWFLGAATKTMAAAFGLAAVGAASPAHAERGPAHAERDSLRKGQGKTDARGGTTAVTYRCCTACNTCGCSTCGSLTKYYCTPNSGSCSGFCTSCRTYVGSCYSITSGC